MLTMNDIQAHVIENGFGVNARREETWLWSKGIQFAYDSEPERWAPYIDAARKQVETTNYGGFYESYEKPVAGSEYYICPSPFGQDIYTGIMMHREYNTYLDCDNLVMYFQFER